MSEHYGALAGMITRAITARRIAAGMAVCKVMIVALLLFILLKATESDAGVTPLSSPFTLSVSALLVVALSGMFARREAVRPLPEADLNAWLACLASQISSHEREMIIDYLRTKGDAINVDDLVAMVRLIESQRTAMARTRILRAVSEST